MQPSVDWPNTASVDVTLTVIVTTSGSGCVVLPSLAATSTVQSMSWPLTTHEPAAAGETVALLIVRPAGIVSSTNASVAGPSPAFVTFSVQLNESPTLWVPVSGSLSILSSGAHVSM